MCTAHPTGRSRRTGLVYPNGAAIAYSYDAASRLLAIDNQTNSGQHKYAYTYDKVGNRKDMTVTSPSGVGVHLYDYDKTYQVTEVDYPAELDYLATDSTFNYDDAGNRTSVIDANGTTPYVANALNQYTSANGTYYQYDTSGNMIYDGHYVFDYDPENRLNKVKKFEQGPTALALACDTTLTFTMGGDADWFTQTQEHYFEGDAAQSGDIADSQQSWMQATVSGTGYISFYWKVSTDGGDYLRFYIDDQLKEEHGGVAGWNQSTKYYVSTGGSHTLKWVYIKNSTGSEGSDCAWVDKILWEVPVPVGVDKGVDSLLSYTSGGNSTWSYVTSGYYGGDSAQSGSIPDSNDTWMQTTVTGPGTFKFWWKVSSESSSDYLEFYLDSNLQDSISGSTSWAEKSYNITGAGAHTLKWRYVKDDSDDAGEDCGWVDHVQWSAPIAEPATDAWSTLTYTYDASGRRIEKCYDDTLVLKYLYDDDHCIAEYDASNNLRRKYVFGPGVDQPICMIEGEATNYYHSDALGSIIALTDASGDAVQVYEYDVHGRVGATDPDHSNRFLFTGREFDKETGLYYYRARYYNAEIGRFLQTDPIGYGDGLNWYRYCGNNSVNRIDPSGLAGTHRKVCIYIEVPGLPPGFPSKIAESINDWEYIRVAGDVDQIIAEIGTLDALYGSGEDTYELSFQGGIPNAWSFGDDPKKNILSPSDENPIVQILRAIDPNKVTKVDWRNIIVPDKGNVSQLDEVLKYSGTTIENTFVVDLHLNCPISPVDGGRLVIYDTGKPRGYELVNPAPGAPNADYDIWGAVYSFKPGQEPEEIWKYMTGNSDRAKSNNAKQPY